MRRCCVRWERSWGGVPADPGAGPRPFKLPGDAEHYGRPRPFDVTHLRLRLRLDVAAKAVDATAELTVSRKDRRARTLVLDAVGFTVARVTLRRGEGEPDEVAWRYDGEALAVTVGELPRGESAVVAVTYRVKPRRGLYFLAPDEAVPTRARQVWSQCQDEDARHWFPCHDAPHMRFTTEVIATAPRGWTVLSNGALLERVDVNASECAWHWSQDEAHPSYLVALVAGEFATLDDTRDPSLPIAYHVDPGREEDARRTFGRTPDMIARFAELTGAPYPWRRYDQVAVHDFIFGGMENTTLTVVTDRALIDARAALDATADDLVAHELAHQWFGDLVTCRDWSHAWLNEGFATFFEHVDAEMKWGRDGYLYNLKEHAELYFAEDEGSYRRPIVCASWASPIDLFDRHLYEKGGWVLHMLRAELGDEVFFEGVAEYLRRHRGGAVETRDLARALEDVSGRSLEAFFEQWVFRAGHPEVEVSVRHDPDAGALTVGVRQTQRADAVTPVFRFTVEVVVVDDAGAESLHALAVDDVSHAFTLPCPRAPRRVAVDPSTSVLARWRVEVPRDLLLDALASDPRAAVRWRAAQALARKRDDDAVVDALARAMDSDPFWGVAAECAAALGELRTAAAFEALSRALTDAPHPKVRRAAARALGDFRTDASAALLCARLRDGDASVLVEAECARAAGRTRRPSVLETLVEVSSRSSWRDVVRAGCVEGLGHLRDERALPAVMAAARYGVPSSTRRAAVGALAELGEGKTAVREALESLLDELDPYLSPEVLRALARLRDPRSAGPISRCADRADDGRVRRAAREALRDLNAREGGDEVRRLRDELDALKEESRALRDALRRVEATLREPTTKGA
ncbi:MAG: M1 family aminopeptidase [Polyangiales bacterium]